MPRLKVSHPDQTPTEYEFGEQVVTIGREVDNLVVIDAAAISRHHAEIEFIEGTWWLRDLGSSNGTFHQGVRIERTRLHDRASFEIGGWKFRFSQASTKSAPGAAQASSSAKSRAKGKKRSRVAAQAAKTPLLPPAPPPEPPAAISIPAASPLEPPPQKRDAPVPEGAPQPLPSKPKFKLAWPQAIAAILALTALVLVFGRNRVAVEKPPPPSTERSLPRAAPPVTLAMRESEPPLLPPITPALAKQAQLPPIPAPPSSGRPTENQLGSGRKLLFAPGADGAGFQPVLSPRLDRVLHVKKSTGNTEAEPWVDVCLNEEVILRRVRLSTEDQLRFSRDGSTWAVQAQDVHGGKFIALRDRTIRLEGEVVQWLGNRDFSHIAVVSRHQGEDNLAIDGVWRSSYHHIRDLRLSEDGLQWAYVAMKFSPEDALEYPAGERVVTQDGPMPICQEVLALELAPQGGRAAWVAAQPGGKQEVVTATGLVWQTPPMGKSLIQSLTLSDDGRRLAWAFVASGSDPVFHLESGGSWELPLGASGETSAAPLAASLPPSITTRICFSKDGWHAVFAASGRSSALMSEGGAISRHSVILLDSLTLSPDGRRLAFVAMEPAASAGNPSAQLHHASLWLDGKPLLTEENAWVRQSAAGNRITMAGISSLHFSPDGSRLACLRSIPQSSGKGYIRQAWLDGRIIPEKHDHALALAWTDSDILSLAAVHSDNESIERVDCPPRAIR